MRTFRFSLVLVMLIGLGLLSSACTPATPPKLTPPVISTETASPTAAPAAFTDPFAYCAAVGTIDQPDARYTGEKVPETVIQGFIQAANLTGTTEPLDVFKQTTIWRCMDKQVYVCNFGANLPCDAKANTDKTPTQGMNDFCKANPDAEFIPAYVTSHTTIYSWHCVKDVAEVLKQIDQADAAGYLERIWYPITPGK